MFIGLVRKRLSSDFTRDSATYNQPVFPYLCIPGSPRIRASMVAPCSLWPVAPINGTARNCLTVALKDFRRLWSLMVRLVPIARRGKQPGGRVEKNTLSFHLPVCWRIKHLTCSAPMVCTAFPLAASLTSRGRAPGTRMTSRRMACVPLTMTRARL